jgi:polar amino acid transport system substrate-binding protein
MLLLLNLSTLNAAEKIIRNEDKETYIRIALHEDAPWSYRENNEITGIEVDMLQRIADEIGMNLDIMLVPERRCLALASAGVVDLTSILLPLDYESAGSTLLIDGQPLFQVKGYAVSLKGRESSIKSLVDLYRFRVGHIRFAPEVEDVIIPSGFTVRMRFNNNVSMLKSLMAGRIDVIYTTAIEAGFYAKELGVEERLQMNSLGLIPAAVFSAWSAKGIGSRKPEVRKQFNITVEKLKREGVFARILQRYGELDDFGNYGSEVGREPH